MNKISFEGIGEVVATFLADGDIRAGQVVKLSGDSTVKTCAAGEKFCGVAVSTAKKGCVAVQVGGFAQVSCGDSNVTVGYGTLTANGTGGVKKVGSGDGGEAFLVVANDGAGTITIKM